MIVYMVKCKLIAGLIFEKLPERVAFLLRRLLTDVFNRSVFYI
jgi:hypothetical protein